MDEEIVMGAISALRVETQNWLDEVKWIGNQCVHTDRKIETILELAHTLEEEYKKL